MNNRRYLFALLFAFAFVLTPKTHAQCIPDTNLTATGIYPSPLPDGCVGQPYSQVVQFVFPVDTTVSGFTVPFDSFQITGVANLPAGISYVCDNAPCKFIPASFGQPARGCALVSGTPTMATIPINTMDISVTAWFTVFGTPQSFNEVFNLDFDVYDSPTAGFSFNATSNTVNFTNTSTGATSQMWDFGDGNTSVATSPTHIYSGPGTYNVCLMVDNGNCQDTTCQIVVIGCPPPAVNFSFNVVNVAASFTDLTPGSPTTWLWDFGDGNTSTNQNTTHIYAAAGTYTVCLTVTDSCGTDSTCMPVTIVCPPPSAAFSAVSNLLTVDFTDQSTAATSIFNWLWDFGDGNTSGQMNPQHTYAAPGTYTVCLTVTDTCGTDSSCMPVSVTNVGLADDLFADLELFPNPTAGAFLVRGALNSLAELDVVVTDLRGKIVASEAAGTVFGGFAQRVDLGAQAPGLYFVQLRAGDRTHVMKVIIE